MHNDARMIIGLGSWRGGFDPSLDLTLDDLAAITTPVLLLVGTDDPVGGEPESHQLASLLPDATVELLAGAGHLPWLDDPACFAAHLTAWIHEQRHRRGEPADA
jgi:pimeloyl-ACP methyl ester carboxylesterase